MNKAGNSPGTRLEPATSKGRVTAVTRPFGCRWATCASNAHLHRRDMVVGRCDGLLGTQAVLGQHAHRPGARRREEPEPAVLAERHLGHEVAALVEQPRVTHGDRHAAPGDLAFHDRLTPCVLGDGYSARWGPAAFGAHPASPISIGTPTSEPYSVHDPS